MAVNVNSLRSSANTTIMTAGNADGPDRMLLEPINKNPSMAAIGPGRYLAQLRMKFDSNGTTMGGGVSDRILPVVLTLNGNTATSCTSGQPDDTSVTSDPHTNPRNCRGTDGTAAAPANYYSWGTNSAVTDPALIAELMKLAPPQYVSSTGFTGSGKRNTASSNPQRIEYNGVMYTVSPTYEEGSVITSSTGSGLGGGGNCGGVNATKVCVNGSFRVVSSDIDNSNCDNQP